MCYFSIITSYFGRVLSHLHVSQCLLYNLLTVALIKRHFWTRAESLHWDSDHFKKERMFLFQVLAQPRSCSNNQSSAASYRCSTWTGMCRMCLLRGLLLTREGVVCEAEQKAAFAYIWGRNTPWEEHEKHKRKWMWLSWNGRDGRSSVCYGRDPVIPERRRTSATSVNRRDDGQDSESELGKQKGQRLNSYRK